MVTTEKKFNENYNKSAADLASMGCFEVFSCQQIFVKKLFNVLNVPISHVLLVRNKKFMKNPQKDFPKIRKWIDQKMKKSENTSLHLHLGPAGPQVSLIFLFVLLYLFFVYLTKNKFWISGFAVLVKEVR